MNGCSFLFNSVKAAQEVAYALRGRWDGYNGVNFLAHDYVALRLATALCNTEYCEVGNKCDILDNIRESRNVLMLGLRNTAIESAIASQMAGCFNQNLESDGESFWLKVSKVAQDVAELQQLVQLAGSPVAE